MGCEDWVIGGVVDWRNCGGLRRNVLRGRRPSHVVVAGCGATVEGGWDAVVSCGAKEEVIKGWRERAADFNKY